MKYCVLYNPKSGDNTNLREKIENAMFGGEFYYMSMPEVTDFRQFFAQVKDNIIICGGDGTLNYFINNIAGIPHNNHIFYFDSGSGNDFHTDVRGGERPYAIDIYLENLPIVRVNGHNHYVLNGCGCGIDSFACFEGEKKRQKTHKPINYTSMVIKGVLGSFKPFRARITVDGIAQDYNNVWLAPVMNGRFFGGGVEIAPMQNRLQNDTITIVIGCANNRLKAAKLLSSVTKGGHIKNEKNFKFIHGKHFKVELSRPMELQVDGEIIRDVSSFEVFTTKR